MYPFEKEAFDFIVDKSYGLKLHDYTAVAGIVMFNRRVQCSRSCGVGENKNPLAMLGEGYGGELH